MYELLSSIEHVIVFSIILFAVDSVLNDGHGNNFRGAALP